MRGKNKKTLAEKADAEKDSPKRDGKSNSEKSGADGDCPTRGGRSARGTSKTKQKEVNAEVFLQPVRVVPDYDKNLHRNMKCA
jgi:hypothetical protein